MSIGNSENRIIETDKDSLEQAVDVLAAAFFNDTLVRYTLSAHSEGYPERVRVMFRFFCGMYLTLGLPVIGVVQDRVPVGIACLSVPGEKKWPETLVKEASECNEFLGKKAVERMSGCEALKKKYAPDRPYCYLAALGVHPDYQGRGLAGLLLDRTHEISGGSRDSSGVYLETASMKNVDMYRHFGYNLISKDSLENTVDLWYLFRPENE